MAVSRSPHFWRLAAEDPPLAACGFDAFERESLAIARHFFQSFAEPQSCAWYAAIDLAEQCYPAPFGATLAMALARVLMALKRTRKTAFNYIRPGCLCCANTITQEERYLISTLQAVRAGRRSEALTHAMMVCQGEGHMALVEGFDRLCLIIGEGPLAA